MKKIFGFLVLVMAFSAVAQVPPYRRNYYTTNTVPIMMADKIRFDATPSRLSIQWYSTLDNDWFEQGFIDGTASYFFFSDIRGARTELGISRGNSLVTTEPGLILHSAATETNLFQVESAASALYLEVTPTGDTVMTNAVLKKPQWVDVTLNYAYSVTGPSAPSLTAVTNSSAIQALAFDNGDILYAIGQMPHNLAVTNSIFPNFYFNPHVHFCTIGTLNNTHSNVTWRMEWDLANVNGGWTTAGTNSVTMGVTNNFTHYVVSLGPITNAVPSEISAVFRCRIMRPASVAQDYSNSHDVLFLGTDLHVPVGNDTAIGSREQYSH